MSTVNRNRGGLRVVRRAYPHHHLALWLIAVVPLVMATAALVSLTMAGTPSGPLDMPIPQPAPVGP